MNYRGVKIRQLDKQDCAAACLASVSYYYGLKTPITTIRRKCGTTIEGTNIKGILEAASYLKLEAHAYKSSSPCYTFKHLSEIPVPSILHFKKSDGWLHFTVLLKVSDRYVLIMDPADGEIHKMDENEFSSLWTGYIITVTPSADFKKGDLSTPLIRRISGIVKHHKEEILPSLIGSLIYVLIGLSIPLYLQTVIDGGIDSGEKGGLILSSFLVILLIILSLFIGYIRTILIIRGGIRIDGTLIMGYVKHILRLPISFFKERDTGEIHSRVNDIYRIRSFVSGKLTMIFISILALVFSFGLLFSFYWKLAFMVLLFIPLYCLIYHFANIANKRHNKLIIEAAANFNSTSIATISSIETIKNFGAEEFFYRKIEEQYSNLGLKVYNGGSANAKISTITDTTTHLLTFLVVIMGTISVANGDLTTGELVSFYTISSFFTSPLSVLIEGTNELNEAKTASQRVFEILDLESENIENGLTSIPPEMGAEIKFNNVSFKYPGKLPLFENLSFSVPEGKVTTIIGKNGCGKSTLASLLMRNYLPNSGNITIGNLNINHFKINEWRKYISIIPQDNSLFNGSVLENIIVGKVDPDIKKVVEICELVGMIDFINRLPEGLASNIGENGKFLSGGERVKITFARALYRDPKILIMDEATSHLDSSSAEIIYRLARDLASRGITIINISHDEKFTQYSDYIVNLNKCDHIQVNNRTPLCCESLT